MRILVLIFVTIAIIAIILTGYYLIFLGVRALLLYIENQKEERKK